MILLDYKDRRPIYEQVVAKLEELMLLGVMKENEPLPSVRSFAMELSINPNTIQRAYVELERQGYIYTVKGKGSFVADNQAMKENKKKEVLLKVSDMIDEAIRVGIPGEETKNMVEIQYEAARKNGGGHSQEEEKGDEQFEISDGRSVDEIYQMIEDNGMQPVMTD